VVLLVCVVGVIAIGLTFGNVDTITQAVSDLSNQPVYNQITFVGNDQNLWLVSPDGTNRRQVTDDSKGYTFPTWSPDGRHLAFIGPQAQENTALYISSANEPAPAIVYNDPNSSPFYLYWAPDSQTITFLAQEGRSMAMHQTDVDGSERLLGEGAPFYWVWSPQSDKLLMHVGGDRTVSEQAHISILENGDEAVRIELGLDPGRFQAPVWSSDGSHFYYVAESSDGVESIYKTNADTLEQQPLTPVSGVSFLTLSPDDQHLAYLEIERNNGMPFGSAYIINTDGTQQRLLTDRLVGSMYWSPDGSKLAVLTADMDQKSKPTAKIDGLASPLRQQITFRWWVYHLDTKKFEPLISFSPTSDFFQTIPFFDQYHLSLTFWSPDSRYFVMTKRGDEGPDGTVWVIDTTNQEEPRQIGEGRLAVWSWQ
jgi:Tol biopolymer transport system component